MKPACVSFSKSAIKAMQAAFAETKTDKIGNDWRAVQSWCAYMLSTQGIAVYVPTSVTHEIADQVDEFGIEKVKYAIASVIMQRRSV